MIQTVRRLNNRAAIQYERYGTKIFLEALKKQAVNYDPMIMVQAYIDFYQFAFVLGAKNEYNRIRVQEAKTKDFSITDFFLNTWKDFIKTWVLQNQMQIIAGVNDNTLEMIRQITAESLQNYENPDTIASKLISLIGSRARSLAIARTEGTTAYNMGTQRSARDWQAVSGDVMYKVWIHSGSKRDPRITHIQAQNKPIPMDDNFDIGGVAMSMPGDKKGGANNVINCGCTHTYLSERLARKRFPKSFEK
jgi:hypothetical protein